MEKIRQEKQGSRTMNLGNKFLSVLSSSKKLDFRGENGISSVIDAIKREDRNNDWGNQKYEEFIYALEELGFLYLDWERNKVRIEPQSLIRSVHSAEETFLLGARIPTHLDNVKMLCNRHGLSYHENQYDSIFPTQIKISGQEDQLTTLANELKIELDPVPRAYQEAVSITDFQNMTNSWKFNDASKYQGNSRNPETMVKFFNPTTLLFDGLIAGPNNRYSMGKRKKYGTSYYIYKYAENSLKVAANVEPRQVKWYCLSQRGFKLAYNDALNVFYIPRYCPLPLGFARSLAMCSCLPPQKISLTANEAQRMGFKSREMDFLEYRGIPRVIANIISSKMDMKLYFQL